MNTQWTDRRGEQKIQNKLLDRPTQMSEASQGGVREAAVKAANTIIAAYVLCPVVRGEAELSWHS